MKNIAFIFSFIILLASCTANRSAAYDSYRNVGFVGGNNLSGFSSDNSSDQLAGFKESQMIIYNASVGLTVKNPDSAAAKVTAVAKKYEGYVVSVSNSYVSIRVKSENLNSAVKEIETFGKVRYKTISGNDVTMEYNDLTIRLDNANKARQRYLELLSKAEDVKAALEVEKELERLNKEIDLLEMQIRNINQQVDYSLINVSIEERKQPGILGYAFIGLYKGVKWLFVWN